MAQEQKSYAPDSFDFSLKAIFNAWARYFDINKFRKFLTKIKKIAIRLLLLNTFLWNGTPYLE